MIQLILTAIAWKRGWKALALIPIGMAFVLGFAIGTVGGANDAGEDTLMGLALALDIVCTLVLAGMAIAGRRTTTHTTEHAPITI